MKRPCVSWRLRWACRPRNCVERVSNDTTMHMIKCETIRLSLYFYSSRPLYVAALPRSSPPALRIQHPAAGASASCGCAQTVQYGIPHFIHVLSQSSDEGRVKLRRRGAMAAMRTGGMHACTDVCARVRTHVVIYLCACGDIQPDTRRAHAQGLSSQS